ncbi:MAG: dihydrolipoyl dehydrogenase [Armatimonadetes bacterium]|nr:dihydrolipoyl dehydrogenase [Armatimonadota bacterium]
MKQKTDARETSAACAHIVTPDVDIAATLLVDIPGLKRSPIVFPSIQEQILLSPDFDIDICVIGSGPAGYVAAIRAAQLGARVVIVENGAVGGACLNVGCIPTKVLLSCVTMLENCRRASEFGVDVSGYKLNLPVMMERKAHIVKQLIAGVEGLFRKNKIRLVRGTGRITGEHEVTVTTGIEPETIKANKIIIATGSTPATLPLPGLEIGGDVWTSSEALEFSQVPKKLLVIGAGAIGLEFGYTFEALGTDVTVVEIMPQILPAADTETANELQKLLEHGAMKFMLNASVTRAENIKGGKRVYIQSDGIEKALDFDKALVAVGRKAVLEDIGLEKVGVKHDGRKIIVNESMQTNIAGIYAVGDVIGEPMLAHVGWTEGIVAVEHALGLRSKMSYKAFPACVYTNPECASVGLTEEQAKQRHGDIRIGKFGFSHNGKAMGIGETQGFIKIISEPKHGEILGVHIVGPDATDLIIEGVLAIQNELTIDEVVATIHAHPTLNEVFQEAAYDTQARSIHK